MRFAKSRRSAPGPGNRKVENESFDSKIYTSESTFPYVAARTPNLPLSAIAEFTGAISNDIKGLTASTALKLSVASPPTFATFANTNRPSKECLFD